MAFPVEFDPSNTSNLSALFRSRPIENGVAVVFSGGRRPDRYFAAWLFAGELDLPLVQSQVPVAGAVAFIDWKVDPEDVPHSGGSGVKTDFGVAIDVTDHGATVDGHAGVSTPVGGVKTEGDAGVDVSTGEVHTEGSVEANLFGVGIKVSASTSASPTSGFSVDTSAETSGPITPQPMRMSLPVNPFAPGAQSPLAAVGTPPGSVVVYSIDEPVVLLEVIADIVVHFSSDGRETITAPETASGPEQRISTTSNFHVQIGEDAAGFSTVSAVASGTVGSRGTQYPNIVLTRALTSDRELYQWRENLIAGAADVRSLTIHQLTPAGEIISSWWIEGAWPVRWRGPSFDAMASALATEEIEVCVSRIQWR